ncbi:MAG: DUF5688 family protein [Hespellia sp.]|nr:DUF5688 family protein [Hespellia sp.]
MDYQSFLSAVERGMNERLSDDITVSIRTTVKNNGMKKQGITIAKKDVNISPTIYLEEFYQQYQNGKSLEEIIKKLDHFYHEVRYEESLDVETIQSFDKWKDKIMPKLINKEKNQGLLNTVPYMEFQDLALVYYVLLDVRGCGSATITVTNAMMDSWKMGKEELYHIAQLNGRRTLPATLAPMQQIIDDLICPDSKEELELFHKEYAAPDEMYVLSNKIRSFGAAVMAYDHVLEMIADKLENSFYILPSSIHEVIIVCESRRVRRSDLDETIREVNDTQVEAEEVLGNHAYYYDRVRKVLYF